MNVEVSDGALGDDLDGTLRRVGYAVVRTGRRRLHVDLGAEQRGAATVLGSVELELDLYVRAWEARHPGSLAERMSDASRTVGG